MFETYEELMERKLDMISDRRDRRQGSLIFDALAPNAAETAAFYADLQLLEDRTFADTAIGEDLTKRCAERGIYRKEAVKATFFARFLDGEGKDFLLPQGSRFLWEDLYYSVTGQEADGRWIVTCETEGETGNRHLGEILPTTYIEGLVKAVLTEVRTDGEEAEEDASLRERYRNSFAADAFGGNIADYKQRVMAMQNVGGVKVYPVWQGGGTVKLVVLDRRWQRPTETELQKLQEEIDPNVGGKGYGISPIGHKVTVVGAEEVKCTILAELTIETGISKAAMQEQIFGVVASYLQELRRTWAENERLVVRVSHLESRILDIEGIIDVTKCRINLGEGNLLLETDQIPVLDKIEVI